VKYPDAAEASSAIKTSYSRWIDHSIHLCSKTVRAIFMAHGSSVMRPLSLGICPAVEYSR